MNILRALLKPHLEKLEADILKQRQEIRDRLLSQTQSIDPSTMKKYLLFSGQIYYADGGWNDYKGLFYSVKSAEEHVNALSSDCREWWQIVDFDTQEIIKSENEPYISLKNNDPIPF